MRKLIWVVIVVLAILVGFIPISYIFTGINRGFLELKSQEVLDSSIWWYTLIAHIGSGSISILIGWIQFNKTIQRKYLNMHRTIGKIYVVSSLICGLTGVYISIFATGGWVAALGFLSISCIFFYATLMGYFVIKKKLIMQHQNFMTYSYAAILSSVTLRIYIPLATLFTDDYVFSYTIIAWVSWIPNLFIAFWINKNRNQKSNSLPLITKSQ